MVVALRRLMPDLLNVVLVGAMFIYIFSVGVWCDVGTAACTVRKVFVYVTSISGHSPILTSLGQHCTMCMCDCI